MEGYNISLLIGTKTILGRTQEDLTISAQVKESLSKDDQGVKRFAVVGHEVTFKVSALIEFNPSSETTPTKLDRDDVIALALTTGAQAVVAVKYQTTAGVNYGGNAIITGYSESSNADATSDATLSLDLKVTGAFAVIQ